MKWEIIFYLTMSGQPIVQKFIDDLPKPTRAKVFRKIDLLGMMGTDLGLLHTRLLGGGLTELQVRSGRGLQDVRIFYVFASGKRIYLLHGFIKKTQQIPDQELKIAQQRKKEIQEKYSV